MARYVCVVVYRIDELGPEAQDKAHSWWVSNAEYPWHADNVASLMGFAEWAGVSISDYEYGGYSSGHISYRHFWSKDILNLSGVRLWKWINANLFLPIKSCPFTGYYMDDVLLDSFREFMERPDSRTLEDLIHDALWTWVKVANEDVEEYFSLNSFLEIADLNEYEFDEQGNLWR